MLPSVWKLNSAEDAASVFSVATFAVVGVQNVVLFGASAAAGCPLLLSHAASESAASVVAYSAFILI